MSFPNGSPRRIEGIRLRPVEEWQSCIVYTPAAPALYLLNLAAWYLVELCDGRSMDQLRDEYLNAVGGKLDCEGVDAGLRGAISELERAKIITLASSA